ncbi:glycosyltransferase [Dactylosporangium sp. NPDC051484]|uniref:glycosyltransferase n=1 Tax=Dactylosporangium sp. NPDC051484 TaxID=3154942 RepID=UPI0034502BE6
MKAPLVSIVIPAHNEASVIGRNLARLLEGTAPGEFDVIVVPNACTDRTAEVAAAVTGVRVIESPIPGKVPALRLGDEACLTFPRVYLDADVELTAASVRALVAACARPGVLACSPVPELDLARVGRLIGRVHRVHDRMMAPLRALAGAGVYVLTEAGHARVFPMPDVISDDGWVHASFAPHERAVVAEARSVVRPARTVGAHLDRRVRVRRGNRQLAALRVGPDGSGGSSASPSLGSLVRLVRRRTVSPVDATAYLSVLFLDRAVSRLRRDDSAWGSDASTRTPALSGD